MNTPHSRPLTTLTAGLLATPTARLPYQHDVLLRSFILERPTGNVVVYNSPGVTESADSIRALGGASRLLVNHAHEAMYGAPELDVPVYVHERDHAEVSRSLPVAGTFAERHMIGDDLQVIPTPGHTPGTTSYLWNNGDRRFLFTGDFIWIEHGEWKAVVLDETLRPTYLESLRLVRDLDFDVLVPWGATEDSPPYGLINSRDEIRQRVGAIIARVQAGDNR
ncbi:MBL fold metallo-hydrolase [Isoptericola sp. BMS4]|uniref:MBL fold metallo-hydrolase n=1 Tax=Isoptericola sp. BMS4 TaxID=2527875 RepID=UPI00196B1FAF|nr:MBL fold metallo-hydrolase [Isoptericola sp. BMS4]